ncbi:leishmanolysin-like peptidase [Gigantopelta aegis]|uniref:leishmanolysin-like peptidase n=1 Tax=Gigantopelta aegis TaxID=1735272 RepID=UPI001B887FCC|nr:leishmanolysin-like peptidase [Gigantopelta aegis]
MTQPGSGMMMMLPFCTACFLVVGILCVIVAGKHHTCYHQIHQQHEVFYGVDVEPRHVLMKRSADQPLRIHLHYDDSLTELPLDHRTLVKKTVLQAVHFWENTLRVRATMKPIRLRKQCSDNRVRYQDGVVYCVDGCSQVTKCGDIVIPSDHQQGCLSWNSQTDEYEEEQVSGTGINGTDFVLYVATVHSKRCQLGSTVAYAAHCQQERVLDRPVAGYFSICPQSISMDRLEQLQLLSTMKHEILHALGFTAGLYAFYRDENGNPRTERNPLSNKPRQFNKQLSMYQWSESVVKTVYRNDWKLRTGAITKVITVMATPKVKAEVRVHFNCSDLEGAELEDQGVDGTALTHWEKRIFENEAMTGTYTQNSVISRITLAMMEDTGWYKANYERAELYEWAKNLGCDFVRKSCYDWIEMKQKRGEDIYPYCERVKRGQLWTDCSNNRHSVALCNLVEYTKPLEPGYQYFTSLEGVSSSEVNRFGGSVQLADFCPFLQEFSWTNHDEVLRGSSCRHQENSIGTSNNFFGEKYGNQSKCFNHANRWFLQHCYTIDSPQHSGSGCYEYKCSDKTGLTIFVDGHGYRCYREGQVIDVHYVSQSYLHKGTLMCPNCQEVCQESGVICPPDLPIPPHEEVALRAPCAGSSTNPNIYAVLFLIIVQYVFLVHNRCCAS